MRCIEIQIGGNSFTKIPPLTPHPPYAPPPTPIPQYPHPPLYPKGPGPMGPDPWARTHGPQGLPARGQRAGGRRGSPWGPWAQALWGIGVGGDIGV